MEGYFLELDGTTIVGKAFCGNLGGDVSPIYTEITKEQYGAAEIGGAYVDGVVHPPEGG